MNRPPGKGAYPPSGVDRIGEGRRFALTLTVGFLVVAAIGYWRGAEIVAGIAAALAVISVFAAAFVPGRLGPARKAWMRLGDGIGRITTPILLAVVYYGLVTPIGLMRRLVHRSSGDQGWYRRPPLPPPGRMERQF